MILYTFLTVVAVFCLITLKEWRYGPFLMILVAIVQDPLRKMIPGHPGFLVLSSSAIWGTTVLGAILSGDLRLDHFRQLYPRMANVMIIFAVLLLPSAVVSATYSPGSWQITLVGIFIYGSLLLGIVLGTLYPLRSAHITWLLSWYCFLVGVSLVGGWLERSGIWHETIGTGVFGHHWATYRMGGHLGMTSGFYRSPDVMGWHAATMVMLCVALALRYHGTFRYIWIGAAGWAFASIMFCARRKMISMLPVFAGILIATYIMQRRGRLVLPALVVLLLVSSLGIRVYNTAGRDTKLEGFYITTLDTAEERVQKHAFGAVATTYKQAGFFGYGLGMASQGTQHINVKRPRAWQEGGVSKIMAEMGVPGLIGFAMLGLMLTISLLRTLANAHLFADYPLYAGLVALFLANASAGVVSAQILGDPFVAAFLSLLVGLVLAARRARQPVPQRTTDASGQCPDIHR